MLNNHHPKGKPARTSPKIAGIQIYGQDDLTPSPGNSVHKHQQKYHVFVGLKKILVTEDRNRALTEAARPHLATDIGAENQ